MSSDALLELRSVAIGYDRRPLLGGIDVSVRRRGFTGLLGANGSGKSTLIKTILGILPPVSGQVFFHPEEGRPPVLGYVPQREALDAIFPLSSLEVVLMGTCGRVGPGRFPGKTERSWAEHCLDETEAGGLRRTAFSQLSGGQKQRVLIARALAAKPDFLLLDEPTAGIDVAGTQAIMDLLTKLHREQRLTILMVNHDLPTVRRHVQDVIWLHRGQVLQGPVGQLLSREKIEELFDIEMN
jgi:ABC-type Mn2+/Zn2+ transport system ATPase subunit